LVSIIQEGKVKEKAFYLTGTGSSLYDGGTAKEGMREDEV